MIYDGDYPWDVRVEKFLTALGEAGHETTLVARNKEGRPRREKLGDIDIFRLPNAGRFETLASFPAFFHPTWLQSVWRAARECRPERIIVRDLPLAPLGIWIGRRLSCPVLIDMAEPYPLALRSNWQFDRLGGLDHLIRNPRFAGTVSEVLDEPGAAKRMSERGLEASEEIYDWRFDADRLVEAVANPT